MGSKREREAVCSGVAGQPVAGPSTLPAVVPAVKTEGTKAKKSRPAKQLSGHTEENQRHRKRIQVLWELADGSRRWEKRLKTSKDFGGITKKVARHLELDNEGLRLAHVRPGGREVDMYDDFDFEAFKSRALATDSTERLVVKVYPPAGPSSNSAHTTQSPIGASQFGYTTETPRGEASSSALPSDTKKGKTPKRDTVTQETSTPGEGSRQAKTASKKTKGKERESTGLSDEIRLGAQAATDGIGSHYASSILVKAKSGKGKGSTRAQAIEPPSPVQPSSTPRPNDTKKKKTKTFNDPAVAASSTDDLPIPITTAHPKRSKIDPVVSAATVPPNLTEQRTTSGPRPAWSSSGGRPSPAKLFASELAMQSSGTSVDAPIAQQLPSAVEPTAKSKKARKSQSVAREGDKSGQPYPPASQAKKRSRSQSPPDIDVPTAADLISALKADGADVRPPKRARKSLPPASKPFFATPTTATVPSTALEPHGGFDEFERAMAAVRAKYLASKPVIPSPLGRPTSPSPSLPSTSLPSRPSILNPSAVNHSTAGDTPKSKMAKRKSLPAASLQETTLSAEAVSNPMGTVSPNLPSTASSSKTFAPSISVSSGPAHSAATETPKIKKVKKRSLPAASLKESMVPAAPTSPSVEISASDPVTTTSGIGESLSKGAAATVVPVTPAVKAKPSTKTKTKHPKALYGLPVSEATAEAPVPPSAADPTYLNTVIDPVTPAAQGKLALKKQTKQAEATNLPPASETSPGAPGTSFPSDPAVLTRPTARFAEAPSASSDSTPDEMRVGEAAQNPKTGPKKKSSKKFAASTHVSSDIMAEYRAKVAAEASEGHKDVLGSASAEPTTSAAASHSPEKAIQVRAIRKLPSDTLATIVTSTPVAVPTDNQRVSTTAITPVLLADTTEINTSMNDEADENAMIQPPMSPVTNEASISPVAASATLSTRGRRSVTPSVRGRSNSIAAKRARAVQASSCVICEASPSHLQKDCPVVKSGMDDLKAALVDWRERAEDGNTDAEASIEAIEMWITRLTDLRKKVLGDTEHVSAAAIVPKTPVKAANSGDFTPNRKVVLTPLTDLTLPRLDNARLSEARKIREASPQAISPAERLSFTPTRPSVPKIHEIAIRRVKNGSQSGLSVSDAVIETGSSDSSSEAGDVHDDRSANGLTHSQADDDASQSNDEVSDSGSSAVESNSASSPGSASSGMPPPITRPPSSFRDYLKKPLNQTEQRRARDSAASAASAAALLADTSDSEVEPDPQSDDTSEEIPKLIPRQRERSASSIGDFGEELIAGDDDNLSTHTSLTETILPPVTQPPIVASDVPGDQIEAHNEPSESGESIAKAGSGHSAHSSISSRSGRSFFDLDQDVMSPAAALSGDQALQEGINEDERLEREIMGPNKSQDGPRTIISQGLPSPPSSSTDRIRSPSKATQRERDIITVAAEPTPLVPESSLAPPLEVETPNVSPTVFNESFSPPEQAQRHLRSSQGFPRSPVGDLPEQQSASLEPQSVSQGGRRTRRSVSREVVIEISTPRTRVSGSTLRQLSASQSPKANPRPCVRRQTRRGSSDPTPALGLELNIGGTPVRASPRIANRVSPSASQHSDLAKSSQITRRQPSPVAEESDSEGSSEPTPRRVTRQEKQDALFMTQPTQCPATQAYNLHPETIIQEKSVTSPVRFLRPTRAGVSMSDEQVCPQESYIDLDEADASQEDSEDDAVPVPLQLATPQPIRRAASQPMGNFPLLSSLPKEILSVGKSAYGWMTNQSNSALKTGPREETMLKGAGAEGSSDESESSEEEEKTAASQRLRGRYAGARRRKTGTGGVMKGW